jgi:hypothetical protein
MHGPGGNVELIIEIVELDSDPGNRQICFIGATHSTVVSLILRDELG